MERYDEEIAVAMELIAESGEMATMRVFTPTDGDEEWEQGEPTEQKLEARMVFLNFRSPSNAIVTGERYFNGTLVEQGDKKVLLAGGHTSFPPAMNGTITRKDGSVWKIVNFLTLDPNGQQILYTLQVRR